MTSSQTQWEGEREEGKEEEREGGWEGEREGGRKRRRMEGEGGAIDSNMPYTCSVNISSFNDAMLELIEVEDTETHSTLFVGLARVLCVFPTHAVGPSLCSSSTSRSWIASTVPSSTQPRCLSTCSNTASHTSFPVSLYTTLRVTIQTFCRVSTCCELFVIVCGALN